MISPALYRGPVRTIPDPKSLVALIEPGHPSYSMVRYLAVAHPKMVARDVLRQATGTSGREPHMAASFEWRLLRANDSLPYLGWRIATDRERYSLEKLEAQYGQTTETSSSGA